MASSRFSKLQAWDRMHIRQKMPCHTCWGTRKAQQKVKEGWCERISCLVKGVYTSGLCVSGFSSEKVYSTERRKIGIETHCVCWDVSSGFSQPASRRRLSLIRTASASSGRCRIGPAGPWVFNANAQFPSRRDHSSRVNTYESAILSNRMQNSSSHLVANCDSL